MQGNVTGPNLLSLQVYQENGVGSRSILTGRTVSIARCSYYSYTLRASGKSSEPTLLLVLMTSHPENQMHVRPFFNFALNVSMHARA